MPPVTGRFAPSPSGRMHLGNLFAALLAWLSVRSKSGRMLLRIEDLDPQRTSREKAQLLMEDLLWLGLDWDKGPRPGDTPGACWYQSERGNFYAACAKRLEERDLVYPCYCTRAELHCTAENAAVAPHLREKSYIYDRRCLYMSDEQKSLLAGTRRPALRARVPAINYCVEDGCQGIFCENLARDCGDFILRRTDGIWAYQLAALADDGAMGVSEVVRGRDLLSSTPRQMWLMEELGYTPPRFYHHPLLLAPDGRRLAKRDRDLDMGVLRTRFKGPEALTGYLAYLAGLLEKPVPCSARELIDRFDWGLIPREDITIRPEDSIGIFT